MYEQEALVSERCGSRGPLRMTQLENTGLAGVWSTRGVTPRAWMYSRPVVLAVLHSLQPLEISAERATCSGVGWGRAGASGARGRGVARRRRPTMAAYHGRTARAPRRARRRGWATMPARAALLDALLVLGCGPLARGGAVGRPGGGATSPRAAGSARRTSYEPAEVRRHLSLPKPVRSLPFTPALAAAHSPLTRRRSLATAHSPPFTAARLPRPAQCISPGVSGRRAREDDAGRMYGHS